MKKLLLTSSIILLGLITTAQTTVNVATAGGFRSALIATGVKQDTLQNLIVTGNIDARDVQFMRDSMPKLAILDLSAVQIMAYTGTGGTSVSFTNPVNEMPRSSFGSKTSLTSIKLPNSITSIGSYAFFRCGALKGNLVIPNSVTNIGDWAFLYCSGFTGNLTVPSSLTSIGEGAFAVCNGFSGNLSIPSSLTSIGIGAFAMCDNIISISVIDNNSNFASIDGVLFNKAKTSLIQCPGGKVADSYIIPNSVNSIAPRAFQYCSKLTGKLNIPYSITLIEGYSFQGCSGFTGSLVIPNSVGTVEINSFYDCSGITSLSIPSSTKSIEDGVFQNCKSLQKITVAKSVPLNIGQNTFGNVNKTTCQLVVPVGTKAAYQSANYWKDFTNITEAIFVTFNIKKGTPIADTIVNLNTIVIAPTDPIRKKSTFAGWFKDSTYTNTWNFTTDLVTTNTTIYAKWTNKVKFNTIGGNAMADTIVNADTKIIAPKDPFKTNLKFAGWYFDTIYTKAWNFTSDIVSTDTTLYAKWVSIPTSIPSTGISNLNIFPNPATDYIKIEGEKLKSITIFDLLSNVQMQLYPKGLESITINISHLKSGYYLVRVKTINDEERILKFFKN